MGPPGLMDCRTAADTAKSWQIQQLPGCIAFYLVPTSWWLISPARQLRGIRDSLIE
jgi:hypothetical protein